MIKGFEQPGIIPVDDKISLIKYYPYYRRTLPWYQDLMLCKQVDNIDFPYDLARLKRMYRFLSEKGECYYIKYTCLGRTYLVGDISLWDGKIAVVIAPEYQNRRIGRTALSGLIRRAGQIGWTKLDAEIYSFNHQSRRAFEAVGFQEIAPEKFRLVL